ncbi:MAG: hypothetical protein PHY93_18805 [Bacteriovorax sp.]|nr:hypothetical protein [Bacteriovorax sp.]
MKALLLVFVLSSFSQVSFAKVVKKMKGAEARSMMEALSASGFELENDSGEWAGKTLIIKTGTIACRYTAISPDEWMTNIRCSKGIQVEEPYLGQSLALAKSFLKYADQDAGVGNRWLSVNSITCSLKYDEKKYRCLIVTDPENDKNFGI